MAVEGPGQHGGVGVSRTTGYDDMNEVPFRLKKMEVEEEKDAESSPALGPGGRGRISSWAETELRQASQWGRRDGVSKTDGESEGDFPEVQRVQRVQRAATSEGGDGEAQGQGVNEPGCLATTGDSVGEVPGRPFFFSATTHPPLEREVTLPGAAWARCAQVRKSKRATATTGSRGEEGVGTNGRRSSRWEDSAKFCHTQVSPDIIEECGAVQKQTSARGDGSSRGQLKVQTGRAMEDGARRDAGERSSRAAQQRPHHGHGQGPGARREREMVVEVEVKVVEGVTRLPAQGRGRRVALDGPAQDSTAWSSQGTTKEALWRCSYSSAATAVVYRSLTRPQSADFSSAAPWSEPSASALLEIISKDYTS
ncbi:hypothetical protein G7046_g6453 [Stylonectria norvegica]|nr:hypothetical protein G7046_g6453 [Stylonectria norvegica]